jgi:hypothetical protein
MPDFYILLIILGSGAVGLLWNISTNIGRINDNILRLHDMLEKRNSGRDFLDSQTDELVEAARRFNRREREIEDLQRR